MSSFDYDFFVIGAGSGGVRAARVAAGHGARVAVAEADKVGGTCVLRGCVPKKLFVYAAHVAEVLEDSVGFGWTTTGVHFDWSTLVKNVNADTEWLSGVYIRNLEKSGAELIRSRAVIEDRHRLRLADGKTVTARYILVATGGAPAFDRGIPGIEHAITSDQVFHLETFPRRLLIIGGGYIAVEFAGIFNNLGAMTTLLHRGEEILRGFDGDVRKHVHSGMEHRGVDLKMSDTITAIEKTPKGLIARTTNGESIEADQILFAVGRAPNINGLGLEAAGVEVGVDDAIIVDRHSRTNVESIFAVGDVTNRIKLTPVAIREGAAVADSLFGGHSVTVDYENIPTAVFSHPEVGTVGLTEQAAKERFPALDIYRATFRPLQSRVAGRDERMLMKLVVNGDNDRILGCHVVGGGAGEMAQLLAIPVKMGATKADFDATMALHPTAAEEIVTMRKPTERYRREAAAE